MITLEFQNTILLSLLLVTNKLNRVLKNEIHQLSLRPIQTTLPIPKELLMVCTVGNNY